MKALSAIQSNLCYKSNTDAAKGTWAKTASTRYIEDPNEWYRALKVPPPKPNSIWIVYEYAGFSTLTNYAQPAISRLNNVPPRKGIFGNVIPPEPLPPFRERANY
eukprot:8458801-Ditylum_brightwellii.AAC.1